MSDPVTTDPVTPPATPPAPPATPATPPVPPPAPVTPPAVPPPVTPPATPPAPPAPPVDPAAALKAENETLKSEITRLNGLLGQAAKTPSSSMPPAKTAETAEDWLAKEIQKQG
jgi:hypothetical protein